MLMHKERIAWVVLLVIMLLGIALRFDQFVDQVLLDDEWHVIHQILQHSTSELFRIFGHADYSIPLGLFYSWIAQYTPLTEALMRAPMFIAGTLILLLFPWYISRRLGWRIALFFAFFLAVSPLLFIYSRTARPYGLTVLFVWLALAAFLRFWQTQNLNRKLLWGSFYVLAAALSTWLLPISGFFVIAPFFWALWQILRSHSHQERAQWFRQIVLLGLAFSLIVSLLLIPPLLHDYQSLLVKSGRDTINVETIKGAVYLWFGCTQTWTAIFFLIAAIVGIKKCWSLAIVRIGIFGILLTLLALLISRPAWIFNPITFVRYLLPLLPLCLLFLAAGCVHIADSFRARNFVLFTVMITVLVALTASSQLRVLLHQPNTNQTALLYQLDNRHWKNTVIPYIHQYPPSPFWKTFYHLPRNSIIIAVAPFSFESFNWNAPIWENISEQRTVPLFMNGFCATQRPGEIPNRDYRFQFRNAVYSDIDQLKKAKIDWIIWLKNEYRHPIGWEIIDFATCETKWRTAFGQPQYEDDWLIAYRISN